MNVHLASKRWLSIALVVIVVGALLSVASLYPVGTDQKKTHFIVDDSIVLTSTETYRQSLGTFGGGENITVTISSLTNSSVNFSILTYNGAIYSGVSAHAKYTFIAKPENYELEFNPATSNELSLQVTVQKQEAQYPLAWLTSSAKVLFFSGVIFAVAILLKSAIQEPSSNTSLSDAVLSRKSKQILLIFVVASLVLWTFVAAQNNTQFATLENWFTDHARHAYTSTLFFKDGFSIFGTPLRDLANIDSSSTYKFVTWPETPHIYPLGSIFLFLPFGFLLQQGIQQVFVFKMEIVFFLVIAHICLYFFLRRFLPKEMNLSLKMLGIFIFYVALVVYAANGMFDAVAFLFAFASLTMFLKGRYDYFLLLSVISVTVKYQAGIILLPLIIFGLIKLLGQTKFSDVIRNKAVIAAALLAALDGYTIYLSAPFLASTRSEFVINGINLFSPHVQLPYLSQSFAVLITLAVTLGCAIYLSNKDRFISLSMLYVMLPIFSMPFFQFWYMPYFFIFAFIPKQKRVLEVTMLWLIFITIMISLGSLSFNPLQIFRFIGKIF
jgi:hypothetical protein